MVSASRAAVLKRLAGLIRLAERGATVAERDNATDKIARLIRRWQVTPAELAQAGAAETPGFGTRTVTFGRNEQWPKSLGFLVARADGCRPLSMKSRVVFAGTEERLDAAVKRYWHIHGQMVSKYASAGQYRPKG